MLRNFWACACFWMQQVTVFLCIVFVVLGSTSSGLTVYSVMMVWKNLAWLYRSHCHRYFSLIKLVTPLPGRWPPEWCCGNVATKCSCAPLAHVAALRCTQCVALVAAQYHGATEQWSFTARAIHGSNCIFPKFFFSACSYSWKISSVQCLISLGSNRTLAAGTLIWVWVDWKCWILFRFLLLGKGYVESEPIKEQQLYRLLRPLPLFLAALPKHIAISSDFGKLRLVWRNSAGWKMKKAATVCIQDLWHRTCLTTRRGADTCTYRHVVYVDIIY